VFPFAVALILWPLSLKRWVIASAVYSVPISYFVWLNLVRYLGSEGASTYQSGVLRNDWSPAAIASDLWLHLQNSVAFWSWPHASFQPTLESSYFVVFPAVAAAIIVCVALAVRAEQRNGRGFVLDSRVARFAVAGIALLVASYAIALALDDNTKLWRTEFLASFAAGWIMAAALYALLAEIPRPARAVAAVLPLVVVGFYATRCGINSGYNNSRLWEAHRQIIASIVAQAPMIADGTVVRLRGIDKATDPLQHNMWFDLALRAAYRAKIAGVYDGAEGANVRIEGERIALLPTGFPTVFHVTSSLPHKVVIFEKTPAGSVVLVSGCEYVLPSGPPAIAQRRYGPIPQNQRCRLAESLDTAAHGAGK
jgi:hypothetical protein